MGYIIEFLGQFAFQFTTGADWVMDGPRLNKYRLRHPRLGLALRQAWSNTRMQMVYDGYLRKEMSVNR